MLKVRRRAAGPARTDTPPATTPPHGARPAARLRRAAGPQAPRQLASTTRKPEISHGQGEHRHHQPCPLHGRQSHHKARPAPGRQARTLTARRMSQGSEEAFCLVSCLQADPRYQPQPARPASLLGAEAIRTGVRPVPLLYFAAVQVSESLLRISNYVSDLWSYGDSNPRPLACHAAASALVTTRTSAGSAGLVPSPQYGPSVRTGSARGESWRLAGVRECCGPSQG